MEQYISKSALVADIERRIKTNKECMLGLRNLDYYQGKVDALNDTLSFLDTLEVKEVDLEKGVKDYIYALPHSRTGVPGGWKCSWSEEEVIKIVRHFFELGVKSKGE